MIRIPLKADTAPADGNAMRSIRASHPCRIGGPHRRLAGEDGITIVETLVAIILLVIGILGALLMIDTANGTTLANRAKTGGVNLAREVAEASRAVQETVPFSQLSDGCSAPSSPANPCSSTSPIVVALQAQPGLAPAPSSPAGEWTIEREGIVYDVAVSVCAQDDPTDKYGNHATGGPWCAGNPSGNLDTAPEDYQRVVADVTWTGTRGNEVSRALALLQSDGSNGPAVTCLRPTSSPCPNDSSVVINTAATTSVPFTATISGSASRLVWYVDGAFQGTVTPSGTSATFTWNLGTVGSGTGIVDGSYEVSGSAFDVDGDTGTSGSVVMQLNRRAPTAPGSYLAGRNTLTDGNGSIGGVDLDWLPVPDKDILYYRIYRRAGTGAPTLVHQTADTDVTSYIDRTPPANPSTWSSPCASPRQAAASNLTYWVVAVDQNGATPREGTPTAQIEVNACNTPPKNPPINALSLTENADQTLTLSGTLPASPTDNDAGDQVQAVRIYRWNDAGGPRDTADRLEYIPVTGNFTFTDLAPEPGGEEQKYCFTNVDLRMQESSCSNVVIG